MYDEFLIKVKMGSKSHKFRVLGGKITSLDKVANPLKFIYLPNILYTSFWKTNSSGKKMARVGVLK